MTVKTVRFNRREASMLRIVLGYYQVDFSQCVKELIAEKLEDLRDIGLIKKITEGTPASYLRAEQITALYK